MLQLTECEGDVVAHSQQLAETHRAVALVNAQLLHPKDDKHNHCTVITMALKLRSKFPLAEGSQVVSKPISLPVYF